jgi:hypothetical protein
VPGADGVEVLSSSDATNDREMLVHLSGRGLHMTTLKRNVLRLDPACQDRIDEIAELAGMILRCEVSRAAVVRAAVQAWLTTNESVHPEQLIKAIRGGMVKRGRKSQRVL